MAVSNDPVRNNAMAEVPSPVQGDVTPSDDPVGAAAQTSSPGLTGDPSVPSAKDAADADISADTRRLHELGYAQELRRRMRGFTNFAIAFSAISILTSVYQVLYAPMVDGGPRTAVIDWVIGGLFIFTLALSLAEICSAYPTAGGLYYWSYQLAKRNKAAWSWFVGWTNMLGQISLTAAIDFGAAATVGFFIKVAIDSNFGTSPGQIFFIYAVILIVHGVLISFGIRPVQILMDVSAWWHVLGTLIVVVVLFALPSHHQSLGEVFTSYTNETGLNWFRGSGLWVGLLGLLLIAYCMQGWDSSAHTSEETENAERAAPMGMINAVWISVVLGFPLLLAFLYALPGNVTSQVYASVSSLGVNASGQVLLDDLSRPLAEFLILIGIGGMLFCGLAALTSNSRMIYAFSRDGAVPGHRLWHRINPRTRTPTNSIWFAAVFAGLLALPSLWSSVAFGAIASVAVSSAAIAFILPVFLRRRLGNEFRRGPVHLGRYSAVINWAAIVWTVVISITLLSPQSTLHVNGKFAWGFFNFAPIACAVVMGYAAVSWIWGRKWFTGPRRQGDEAQLEAIESEYKNIEREENDLDVD